MVYTNLKDLKIVVDNLKKDGKTIVWTNGCFDLLHPGHLETFKKAKELGNILIVGLNGDQSPYWETKPGRPINNQKFRAKMLEGIKWVDLIFIYNEETPILPIKAILPNILIKGGDYQKEMIVGFKEVVDNGGQIIIIPLVNNYSTTSIVNKIKEG